MMVRDIYRLGYSRDLVEGIVQRWDTKVFEKTDRFYEENGDN